ncbi:MAG: hypothetical protein WCK09_20160 [Bacteroidota bacterium]
MKKTIFISVCFILVISSATFAADAPVTKTACVTNAIPGTASVPIPVTVTGFTDIGKFILTMTFDTTRVRFVSAIPNPSLTGMTVTYSKIAGKKLGKLIFEWTGASQTNTSLADGSTLADLTFSYVAGSGMLTWNYTGTNVCQYYSYIGGVLTALNHLPQYLFYQDGAVADHGAPVTHAPLLTITGPGALAVPITIDNFNDIGSMTLNLEYDPAVLTFANTFWKNPALGGSFDVGSVPKPASTNRLIVIQWNNSTAKTLPYGSTICIVNFDYVSINGSNCVLSWFDTGHSCEFSDGAASYLSDLPTADYYKNGSVTFTLIADFMADNLTPPKSTTVLFTDLSQSGVTSWAWSFDRPGVTYVNGTTASSQNPQVQFSDGGLYAVTLVVHNSFLTSSVTKIDYLRVGLSGLWTGNTSSDWNTLSNWDNYKKPDGSSNVVIPSSAPNWPVFDGDMTMGVDCATLTLTGPTSQMTINGDLTFP